MPAIFRSYNLTRTDSHITNHWLRPVARISQKAGLRNTLRGSEDFQGRASTLKGLLCATLYKATLRIPEITFVEWSSDSARSDAVRWMPRQAPSSLPSCFQHRKGSALFVPSGRVIELRAKSNCWSVLRVGPAPSLGHRSRMPRRTLVGLRRPSTWQRRTVGERTTECHLHSRLTGAILSAVDAVQRHRGAMRGREDGRKTIGRAWPMHNERVEVHH